METIKDSFGLKRNSKISVSQTSLLGLTEELTISKERFLNDRKYNSIFKSGSAPSYGSNESVNKIQEKESCSGKSFENGKINEIVAEEYKFYPGSYRCKDSPARKSTCQGSHKASIKSKSNSFRIQQYRKKERFLSGGSITLDDGVTKGEETNDSKLRQINNKLIQKSRIYDRLKYEATINLRAGINSETCEGPGDGEGIGGLIDFHGMASRNDYPEESLEYDSDNSISREDEVEVVDEFGRTRLVPLKDKAKYEFELNQESQVRKKVPDNLIYGSIIQHESFKIPEKRLNIFKQSKFNEENFTKAADHYSSDW
ncbi:hypothetical protein NADFUDRAFT_84038, partial [Nadsonia fulvescens var. elongata DSM 6958]